MKPADIHSLVSGLRAEGKPFAVATVVRTVAATAAKAGAKAVIGADGRISEGWIGGGCARVAVLKAALQSLKDGQPRLVSIQPEDLLGAQGLEPGEEKDGIRFAANMCPSKGTMDVFVEPVMPLPELVILGASPVAVALADLASRMGFRRTVAAPASEQSAFEDAERRIEGFALDASPEGRRYVVVSTQGRGDEAALRAALSAEADFVAFVGSRAKARALRDKLAEGGVDPELLTKVKAPAGLDIGAITPEEIALSILAEIVEINRRGALREASE
ncbi:XdhC/CoxI family protein [Ostreiculturibacter nitratireducens]|uniref:XdhC family protein n=1 Tax=Ostreiculturibacter nitratireducens TaxID=3075226 RepID=UPI0031B5F06A